MPHNKNALTMFILNKNKRNAGTVFILNKNDRNTGTVFILNENERNAGTMFTYLLKINHCVFCFFIMNEGEFYHQVHEF